MLDIPCKREIEDTTPEQAPTENRTVLRIDLGVFGDEFYVNVVPR